MGRILVVEDDQWSRRIVCELLEMRGHEVIAADTVASAREALGTGQPEVVLLDICRSLSFCCWAIAPNT